MTDFMLPYGVVGDDGVLLWSLSSVMADYGRASSCCSTVWLVAMGFCWRRKVCYGRLRSCLPHAALQCGWWRWVFVVVVSLLLADYGRAFLMLPYGVVGGDWVCFGLRGRCGRLRS